jgi:hypothetical protein
LLADAGLVSDLVWVCVAATPANNSEARVIVISHETAL